MASATTSKSHKRLGEFLDEQQEPFNLELCLVERQYSKGLSLSGDSSKSCKKLSSSSCVSNKKRKKKAMLQCSKVLLRALYSKLCFHNKESIVLTKGHHQRDKQVVSVPKEGHSIWFHEDYNMFSSDTCRNSSVCNMELKSFVALDNIGRQRRRCIEDAKASLVSIGRIPLCRVPYVAAEWSLHGQSVKKENSTMESGELLLGPNKVTIRVVHKIKKLLRVCEREITIGIPTKDDRKCYKQFMGPLEIRKLAWERTKEECCQQAGDGAHVTNLLTLDYLNSTTEWRNLEPHMMAICVEISDKILDHMINYEVVSKMIETWEKQPYKNS